MVGMISPSRYIVPVLLISVRTLICVVSSINVDRNALPLVVVLGSSFAVLLVCFDCTLVPPSLESMILFFAFG